MSRRASARPWRSATWRRAWTCSCGSAAAPRPAWPPPRRARRPCRPGPAARRPRRAALRAGRAAAAPRSAPTAACPAGTTPGSRHLHTRSSVTRCEGGAASRAGGSRRRLTGPRGVVAARAQAAASRALEVPRDVVRALGDQHVQPLPLAAQRSSLEAESTLHHAVPSAEPENDVTVNLFSVGSGRRFRVS